MAWIEIELILLFALLVLSALFSGVEAAFISLDRIKLRRMLKKNKRNAEIISKLKKDPDKVLSALLIGNNLVNVLASVIATTIVLRIFANDYAIAISAGIMTFLIVVFGDIAPKRIAIKHDEIVLEIFANKLSLITRIMGPAIWLVEKFAGIVISAFGGGEADKRFTNDEVRSIIAMWAEEGAINKREHEMIHKIFNLGGISAEEIMTPRVEITAVDGKETLEEIKPVLDKTFFPKIPVYLENLDHIVGILDAPEALKCIANGKSKTKASDIMKEAFFIPKTKKLDKLLGELQDRREHIAVVAGEYGEILGIVTIEDVLEEIVGEIEHDNEESQIKKIDNKKYLADGNTEIRKMNALLGTNYNPKEYDTIAGIIMSKLDRIAKRNEKIDAGELEFIVKKTKRHKIEEVMIIDKR